MIRVIRTAGRWRVTVGRLVVYSGRRWSAACAAARLAILAVIAIAAAGLHSTL